MLLIVPYGIETARSSFIMSYSVKLLIVPYGIETEKLKEAGFNCSLLIVPYGIETFAKFQFCFRIQTFNRTLWN